MLPYTKDGDIQVAAVAHPADNATSTTLTSAAAKSVEANAYEEFEVSVLLNDPETGAKAFDLTLWESDAQSGTVGDGSDWTAVGGSDAEAKLEDYSGKAHDPSLGTAAYSDVYTWKVPMRLVSKKFVAAKVVVTHADPTATPATYMALLQRGVLARRS